jgi:hypothetical protein
MNSPSAKESRPIWRYLQPSAKFAELGSGFEDGYDRGWDMCTSGEGSGNGDAESAEASADDDDVEGLVGWKRWRWWVPKLRMGGHDGVR